MLTQGSEKWMLHRLINWAKFHLLWACYHTICPGGSYRSAAVVAFFFPRQMEHGAVNELSGVERMACFGDFDLAFVINVRTCTPKIQEKIARDDRWLIVKPVDLSNMHCRGCEIMFFSIGFYRRRSLYLSLRTQIRQRWTSSVGRKKDF